MARNKGVWGGVDNYLGDRHTAVPLKYFKSLFYPQFSLTGQHILTINTLCIGHFEGIHRLIPS
jgi:hypothetical protein